MRVKAGRHVTGAVTEGLHLDPQTETKRANAMGFANLKAHPGI